MVLLFHVFFSRFVAANFGMLVADVFFDGFIGFYVQAICFFFPLMYVPLFDSNRISIITRTPIFFSLFSSLYILFCNTTLLLLLLFSVYIFFVHSIHFDMVCICWCLFVPFGIIIGFLFWKPFLRLQKHLLKYYTREMCTISGVYVDIVQNCYS